MIKQRTRRMIKLEIYGDIPPETDFKKLEHYLYYEFKKIDIKRIDLLADDLEVDYIQ